MKGAGVIWGGLGILIAGAMLVVFLRSDRAPSLNAGENSVAAAPPAPVFAIRSITQDMPLAAAKAVLEPCEFAPDGDAWCHFSDDVIAGAFAETNHVVFDSSGFRTLFVDYDSDKFDAVLAQLTSAYGAPCGSEDSLVQNAMGATFHNNTIKWCFAGGILSFTRFNQKISESELVYTSFRYVPPAPKSVSASEL